MNDVQQRLLNFARTKALSYLLSLPLFHQHKDDCAFVLVGSVATGLCRADSDVDIAVVCESGIFQAISVETPWQSGRPTQVVLDGVQLHYYGISYETLENKLAALDDECISTYGQALVLHDSTGQYRQRVEPLTKATEAMRRIRAEGKLDMLIRRGMTLEYCLKHNQDLVTIAKLRLELIIISLKVVALLDNAPFDGRKRLFSTALNGSLGKQLRPYYLSLLASENDCSDLDQGTSRTPLRATGSLDMILREILAEARRQGLRIGLDQADNRHIERLD